MLLMGMWISLTKKPMNPITKKPKTVATAIFVNSTINFQRKEQRNNIFTFSIRFCASLNKSVAVLGELNGRCNDCVCGFHVACKLTRGCVVFGRLCGGRGGQRIATNFGPNFEQKTNQCMHARLLPCSIKKRAEFTRDRTQSVQSNARLTGFANFGGRLLPASQTFTPKVRKMSTQSSDTRVCKLKLNEGTAYCRL